MHGSLRGRAGDRNARSTYPADNARGSRRLRAGDRVVLLVTHVGRPATSPGYTGSSSAATPPSLLDPESLAMLNFLYNPVPNPRTGHVPEPTRLHVAGSRRIEPTESECMAYPSGVLRDLGSYRGRVLAGYEPTHAHGSNECKQTYVFWVPPSLFE